MTRPQASRVTVRSGMSLRLSVRASGFGLLRATASGVSD